MIVGFVLTGALLLAMIVWCLFQIRRVDRTIARVDASAGPAEPSESSESPEENA